MPTKVTTVPAVAFVRQDERLSKSLALVMFFAPDRVAQLAEQRTFNP